MTNTCPDKTLISSTHDHCILDVRLAAQFFLQSLKNSTNIPVDEFNERGFELPPRNKPIAVVADSDAGLRRAVEWLEKSDWIVCMAVVVDEDFWLGAQNKDVVQTGIANGARLWQPSSVITQHISDIERALKAQNNLHNNHNTAFRAIDLGCGSGRDMAYLALRGWSVVGVDNNKGALRRACQLASRWGIPTQNDTSDTRGESGLHPNGSVSVQLADLRKLIPATSALDTPFSLNTLTPGPFTTMAATQKFGLVLMSRFLHRPLFPLMTHMVAQHGCVVISQFFEGCSHPNDPNLLLQAGELATVFGVSQGFEVVWDAVRTLEDGRPIQDFISRKL